MAKKHCSRNSSLNGIISRFSRSAIYKKRALYKRKKTPVKKVVAEIKKTKVKPIGGEKNGENRTVPIARKVRVISTILRVNITGFNHCGLQEASLSLWESVYQLGVEAEGRYSISIV